MRILEVSKLYPPFWGGIETVVYDISNLLHKNKYNVDVLCVSSDGTSTFENENGINIYRCASIAHIASTYISSEFVNKWKKIRNNYDIIHIHLPNPLALLAFILYKPNKNIKVIIHWHSDIIKQKILKIPFIPMQNYLLRCCDKIFVTSPIYSDYSKDLKKYKYKINILPIGIDHSRMLVNNIYLKGMEEKYSGKFIIFSLGRHVYYKGFDYLIESAKYLPDNYIILIGGEGELTHILQKKIDSLDLNDKVQLIGKIPPEILPTYYFFADVFCLPSIERSEAYGVVQLEAMACGTPVVSTSIEGSGVPWVNKHNISGLIVSIKNPQALAESFKYLNANPFNKESIVRFFHDNYTREIMVDRLIKYLKEL
ncbi:TPA: glycosyltransferase [Morganella morganii]|nr:GDP-mannose-dependent alpha-(1-6)-phosphatidylinositol monomannoside mannosyltransferase [Morganella morganii]